MRPRSDEADAELLELALATEQVARAVADPLIAARLREIAGEVRTMAQFGYDLSLSGVNS